MDSFTYFLHTLSVRKLLLGIQSGFYKGVFLGAVFDHLNRRFANGTEPLENWEKDIYEDLRMRVHAQDMEALQNLQKYFSTFSQSEQCTVYYKINAHPENGRYAGLKLCIDCAAQSDHTSFAMHFHVPINEPLMCGLCNQNLSEELQGYTCEGLSFGVINDMPFYMRPSYLGRVMSPLPEDLKNNNNEDEKI